MRSVGFLASRPVGRVLAIGAHVDDIEIGAAGTLLGLAGAYPGLSIRWIVCSGDDVRAEEARASAAAFESLGTDVSVMLGGFEDGYLPWAGERVKRYIAAQRDFEPDLILVHRQDDRHQDHRLLGELAWQLYRDHLILEYEVPKYDGDLGPVDTYVPLSRAGAEAKVRHVVETFPSQRGRSWFTPETFWSLLRLRGVEAGVDYAEGFVARKVVLDLGGAT
jgi:LmbE family N-acetylglucosaminyl deacetylase